MVTVQFSKEIEEVFQLGDMKISRGKVEEVFPRRHVKISQGEAGKLFRRRGKALVGAYQKSFNFSCILLS